MFTSQQGYDDYLAFEIANTAGDGYTEFDFYDTMAFYPEQHVCNPNYVAHCEPQL